MANEYRKLVAVDDIVKVAEHAYEQWSLAMVGADDHRKVNEVFKKQYLCKVVKAVAENCPTVDAVEVVRCKDCMKYRDPFCLLNDTQSGYLTAVSPDHFCSCGERRDGE